VGTGARLQHLYDLSYDSPLLSTIYAKNGQGKRKGKTKEEEQKADEVGRWGGGRRRSTRR